MFWQLEGVREAPAPAWAGKGALKGTRARGLTFERKVGKILTNIWPQTRAGVWLRFKDWAGEAWAQPDFYVPLEDRVLIFECKLTECRQAWVQLDKYKGLLEEMLGLPACRVMVCKNLRWTMSPVVDPRYAQDGSVWHTLGHP
jgi:hypothetical protein